MSHSLKHRFIALLLLMAYTVTGTSVLPAVMAGVAGLDGGHVVLVAQSEHGTRLTLHHRDHEFTPSVTDHEGALARTLVSLCHASESGDHQFNSTRADTGTRVERDAAACAVKQAPAVNLAATFQMAHTALFTARDTIRAGGYHEAPPPHQGVRRVRASVQLLI